MSAAIGREGLFITQGLHLWLNRIRQEPDPVSTLKQTEILRRIRAAQGVLEQAPEGPARARAAYRMLDEALALHRASEPKAWKNVSCKSGCSACCHQQVEISDDEAQLLAGRVQGGVEVDWDRLRAQLPKDGPAAHWRLPWASSACIFLSKSGRCRIYEDRPMGCRKYFVTDPPSECEPTPSGNARAITTLQLLEAEIIASAALDLSKRRGNIAQGLMEYLGGRMTPTHSEVRSERSASPRRTGKL